MSDEPKRTWSPSDWRSCAGSGPWASTPGDIVSTAIRRSPKFASCRSRSPRRREHRPGPKVRVAGRIVLRRVQGKVHFLQLRDWTGQIQLFLGKNQVGEAAWALMQELDLGDLIGVDGHLGHTKTGELTVFAESIEILSKSLLPPPEKWHGLTDVEQRSRQRYVDLASNPESMKTFLGRTRIIAAFRKVMADRGFVEVEGPTMQAIAGGAAARPFVTHHNALDIDLYLRIALELHLKRLLVGGMERVFEIGRVFRNEGISRKHNPEFTMLEAYQAYGDYHSMMDLTEALILGAIEAVGGGLQRPWGEATVDFSPPWPRKTYAELCKEHAGIEIDDREAVIEKARSLGIDPTGKDHDVLVGDHLRIRGGRRPDRPRLRHRLPGAALPADEAEARQSRRRRAVRALRPRHGAGERLHRAERPDPPGRALPEPARRPEGRGLDGDDGRRLRPRPQARDAAGRRARRRPRPALHAPAEQGEHPRRDPLPAAQAGIDIRHRCPVAQGRSRPIMYKYLLCWRYLRTTYIALASVVSVMLGVATMIVVNSVMAGFADKMRDRLHGVLADVVVEGASLDGFEDYDRVMARIQAVAGAKIEAMAPAIETPGMVLDPRPLGRGVDQPAGQDHRHPRRRAGEDRLVLRVRRRRHPAAEARDALVQGLRRDEAEERPGLLPQERAGPRDGRARPVRRRRPEGRDRVDPRRRRHPRLRAGDVSSQGVASAIFSWPRWGRRSS